MVHSWKVTRTVTYTEEYTVACEEGHDAIEEARHKDAEKVTMVTEKWSGERMT